MTGASGCAAGLMDSKHRLACPIMLGRDGDAVEECHVHMLGPRSGE